MPAFVGAGARHDREDARRARRPRASSVRRAPSPVSRPRSSPGTSTARRRPSRGPPSRPRSARCRPAATFHPAGAGAPSRSAAAARAATSADRLPAEPPGHEARRRPRREARPGRRPIAAPGSRPRSRRRRRSSPPRSSTRRPPPGRTGPRPCVGAPGTNAIDDGWSVEIVAGASTSLQMRRASSPPMPSGVIVSPARASGPRRSTEPVERLRARDAVPRVRHDRRESASVSSVYRCIVASSLLLSNRRAGPKGRPAATADTRSRVLAGELLAEARRTRRRTSGRRPRCAAPRSSTAPRRRGS